MNKKYTFWTDEEKEKVKQMYRQGYTYQKIADMTGRSLFSVGNRLNLFVKTGEIERRQKPRSNSNPPGKRPEVSKYTFVRNEGKYYKNVLPPEKWPLVENFLAAFCRYALIAEKAGRKLDVSVFIDEYAKIYRQQEVEML